MDIKKHIVVALFYFLLVALMGVLLRFFYVAPIPLNYKFILHAHSHTALLGWVYLGLTTLIYKIFLASAERPKQYNRIFLFTNFCILGMLLTFPIQGYALFSIIFSTLFLFASYWFTWFAFKFIPSDNKNRFSWKLIKTSLLYLVFSSLGPWAVGIVMATMGSESIWYKNAIYFYLHFQYNGWFIFALLGILFYFFEEKDIHFNSEKLKSFYLLLNAGVIFTVFLSVLWSLPPTVFYLLGLAGAVAQVLAFHELYLLFKNYFVILTKSLQRSAYFLLQFAGIMLLLKLLMQLFSAIPYFARIAFQFQDFVIGYLHLVFLGIVITTMLAFLKYYELIRLPKSFVVFFFLAFFSTEILIFYKAISFWLGLPFLSNYYVILACFTCFFPVAIAILFFRNLKIF